MCRRPSGQFRVGFSTNSGTVNTWVNTIHIHSKIRVALRKQLHIKTSSKHKKLTPGWKKMHASHVKSLKHQLLGYGIDPFSNQPLKCFSTGVEIEHTVYKYFNEFVKEQLVNGTLGFFESIKKNNLKTEIVKIKKTNKVTDILNEDLQPFGLIVAKSVSMEEAFAYPITYVPLSIAEPDSKLRQSEKASFRNYLMKEAVATLTVCPKKVC